ncbi:MAG: alpha/beta hydrolase [Phototrophicales bacterium]|nr:MAG: alpha/beta hydrolase [Phototrophicales bacterium]RMG78027.1 MAG: alpha/beta hydrolase [Chloroflexota bacterium]
MPIAQINSQGIFYEDSGGDGTPIIFMHGFLFDHSMFDSQVKALAPDYRCIRFDARAWGQTQWDGQAFDLYDTVADCIGLMDHLGLEKAVIAGMSQGGYAAIRLAIKHPDRVDKLILMSTFKGVRPDDFKSVYTGIRDTWVENGPIDPLLDQLMTVLIGPKERVSQFWDAWRDKWKTVTGNQMFHGTNALLDRDPISDEQVQGIQHPVLITHGTEDNGIPIALAEQMAKLLPNVKKFVRVPDAAHAANMTDPELVNQAIREFLS